ncbi:EAL domain-containing protein [Rheinheimera sp.]|uniref:two-component system response regulator n=1 Tax=Rheinheimera sp. TaxID=1869214 RepID=UPI0027B87E4C|nr:EAL domain-containing protein [Rheinheimera sp.]
MNRNILIVEDEHIVALDLKMSLEDLGHTVVATLAYGEEVLATANQLKPDLVLMDIQLAGHMRGTEAAKLLHNEMQLPVIFLSAFCDNAILEHAEQSLPYGYLIKPYDRKELDASIRMALCRHHADQQIRRSELRLQMAMQAAQLGLWELDEKENTLLSSGIVNDLLSNPPEVICDGLEHLMQLFHPSEHQRLQLMFNRDKDINAVMRLAGVAPRWIELFARHFRQPNQTLLVGVMRDVTEQQQSQLQLRQAHAVFQTTAEGILILDQHFKVLSVNPAFSTITGYLPAEVTGQHPEHFLYPKHNNSPVAAKLSELKANHWSGEVVCLRKDQTNFPAWQHICRVKSPQPDSTTSHYVLTFSNISALRRAEENLAKLAFHDHLTGLGNRAKLEKTLKIEVERAIRNKSMLGVMYLDLDGFKLINDTLGHSTGDRLLQVIAQRIGELTRAGDTAIRVGGDEFVIITPDATHPSFYHKVAEKLLRKISEEIELDSSQVSVSCSIGIACFPEDAGSYDELLKCADLAMFAAKESGRNRYSFFNVAMASRTQERVFIEKELKNALLKNSGLALYYQPIIDLQQRRFCGVEALIRWFHADYGMISTEKFIGIAEHSTLIVEVGAWVIDQVCKDMAALQQLGAELKVSLNLSVRQLEDEQLLLRVDQAVERYQVNPELLQFEITETALQDLEDKMAILQALRERGSTIAIDDFGTGFSSLSRLKNLPINCVKIDRSFVMTIPHQSNDIEITRAVCALCQALQLQVVAEGVETPAQQQFLQQLNCDYAQGYLFAKPMPLSELQTWQQNFTFPADRAAGIPRGS